MYIRAGPSKYSILKLSIFCTVYWTLSIFRTEYPFENQSIKIWSGNSESNVFMATVKARQANQWKFRTLTYDLWPDIYIILLKADHAFKTTTLLHMYSPGQGVHMADQAIRILYLFVEGVNMTKCTFVSTYDVIFSSSEIQ